MCKFLTKFKQGKWYRWCIPHNYLVHISEVLFVVAVLVALVCASVFCGSVYPCCLHWCLIFSLLCLGLVACWCLFLVFLVGVMLQFGGSLFLSRLLALFVILGFYVLVLGLLLWCSMVMPCLVEASSH